MGQYALQILKYYGYRHVLTTASKKHHSNLQSLGATKTFDYNDSDVVQQILQAAPASSDASAVPLILDCIGSQKGTVEPLAKIAQKGSKVAILLPIVVKDSTETTMPEYAMDVDAAADWAEGVEVRGVRTHFYLEV